MLKLGKTATETHAMLVQVYRTDAVSRKCVYDWFKHFQEGKETVDDEPRSGRHYITLLLDSSGYYFPANTIADFRTKLATPLELEHDKWEVRLVEISYPKGYKKRFLHNTLRLDSEEITFPVKHYESMLDLLTNMPRLFEPSIKENFIRIFSEYINKYPEQNNKLFSSAAGKIPLRLTNI